MPSSKEYLDYVLDLLRLLPDIRFKKMMGEYLLYQGDVLFGGIYDNRFLLKDKPALRELGLKEQIPYPGAKPMLLVDIEDADAVAGLVRSIVGG